jgi:hypothetical protein
MYLWKREDFQRPIIFHPEMLEIEAGPAGMVVMAGFATTYGRVISVGG